MRSSILAMIPGFRQQIIPEPRVPSQGSQARGTRLGDLGHVALILNFLSRHRLARLYGILRIAFRSYY